MTIQEERKEALKSHLQAIGDLMGLMDTKSIIAVLRNQFNDKDVATFYSMIDVADVIRKA